MHSLTYIDPNYAQKLSKVYRTNFLRVRLNRLNLYCWWKMIDKLIHLSVTIGNKLPVIIFNLFTQEYWTIVIPIYAQQCSVVLKIRETAEKTVCLFKLNKICVNLQNIHSNKFLVWMYIKDMFVLFKQNFLSVRWKEKLQAKTRFAQILCEFAFYLVETLFWTVKHYKDIGFSWFRVFPS